MKQALLTIAVEAVGTMLGWAIAVVLAALIGCLIDPGLCVFIRSLIR